jgi:hypothetical protein
MRRLNCMSSCMSHQGCPSHANTASASAMPPCWNFWPMLKPSNQVEPNAARKQTLQKLTPTFLKLGCCLAGGGSGCWKGCVYKTQHHTARLAVGNSLLALCGAPLHTLNHPVQCAVHCIFQNSSQQACALVMQLIRCNTKQWLRYLGRGHQVAQAPGSRPHVT